MPSPSPIAGCVIEKEAALWTHAALDATSIAYGEFIQTSRDDPFRNARAREIFGNAEARRKERDPMHALGHAIQHGKRSWGDLSACGPGQSFDECITPNLEAGQTF